jgi:hypothetical protein
MSGGNFEKPLMWGVIVALAVFTGLAALAFHLGWLVMAVICSLPPAIVLLIVCWGVARTLIDDWF